MSSAGRADGEIIDKLGDLAVLSADYFTCPAEQIKGIRSVLTVVGGRVVHKVD